MIDLKQELFDRIQPNYALYVDIGDGWLPIVLELNRNLGRIDVDYQIFQIKEKWFGLRYYCSLQDHPEAKVLIQAAEEACEATCSECGRGRGTGFEFRGATCLLCYDKAWKERMQKGLCI